MTKNPFYNAILGTGYVCFVVLIIYASGRMAGEGPDDNILVPIGVLSLFVLSASIMTYLFLYEPMIMFIDGKRQEALRLFMKTIACFGATTLAILAVAYLVF